MNLKEDQILSVLDAIELNSKASQRDLSRTTGLNLAKVNYLLKKLTQKGFVKLRNVSRNPNKLAYLYILTPHGIVEKSRLTVRFAARTWRDYSNTIARLRSSLESLVNSGALRVVLLGANGVADMVLEAGSAVDGLEVIGIVDPACVGDTCRGIKVVADVNGLSFDRAIPCDHGEKTFSSLAEEAGVSKERLWLV